MSSFKHKNLSVIQRSKIIYLHEEGLNISQIAEELRMSRNTVYRWIRRYEAEGTLKTKPQPKRESIITDEKLERIVTTLQNDPFTTTRQLAQEYGCSSETIRYALRRAGARSTATHRLATRNNQKSVKQVTRVRCVRAALADDTSTRAGCSDEGDNGDSSDSSGGDRGCYNSGGESDNSHADSGGDSKRGV